MASNKSNKNERAAQARKAAQAQVKAQERRTAAIIGISVIAVILLFAGVVYFIVRSGDVPDLESADAVAPTGADSSGGIPISSDAIAGVAGPEDAARLDVYLDFMCPICGQFEETNGEDIDAMVADGSVALYVHPISILDRYSNGTNFSTRAANAAATVADAAPEHFMAFQTAMFENQPAEGTDGLSDTEIADIAVGVGVPQEVADTFTDGEFTKWVIAATDQSSQDGVPGTPTLRMADPGDSFADGKVLEQENDVMYFQPGALAQYVADVNAGTVTVTE
ncbi:thioredoxin domain-containing protein [Demequina sp. NBRC 110051]|uniref:DsbA family protein n=1 Tax=Demequina sp. NBRC 110051 TaxID=1570340 RepID=UPI0009FC9965|nr:thioredoxin domain-containing protein [Demequina sp. NBRC 110051]